MTGYELYLSALDICGLRNAKGEEDEDLNDLKSRSLNLINLLLDETLWLERYLKNDSSLSAVHLEALEEELTVDPLISGCVLAFGLASMLTAEEDPNFSLRLYERYKLNTAIVQRSSVSKRHPIEEMY